MIHGLYVFSKGDTLTVRDCVSGRRFTIVAVTAKKDSDVCYGCCFYMRCRAYPGNSPFASSCYYTVFEEREMKQGKIYERR